MASIYKDKRDSANTNKYEKDGTKSKKLNSMHNPTPPSSKCKSLCAKIRTNAQHCISVVRNERL